MKQVRLNNGVMMPALGYGVFQIPPKDTQKAVEEALAAGYRMIDTAQAYFNEAEVGAAIAHSGLKRDEIFVSTKLWVKDYETDDARRAFDESMQKLGLDTLDLYMLHKPFGNYYAAWRVLESLYKDGSIRAIGVTSFTDERLQDLMLHNEISPMVNQVETNPWCQRTATNKFLKEHGIQQEAWSPFAEAKDGIFTNPVLVEISKTHGKTVGQIILRWLNQNGVVSIAKTIRPERMAENLGIYDFSLSADEMTSIVSLDGQHVPVVDENDINVAKYISSLKF